MRHRPLIIRGMLILAFAASLLVAFLQQGGLPGAARAAAAPPDPAVLWAIGQTDGAGYEFGMGSAKAVAFRAGKDTAKDGWRESQSCQETDSPVYRVIFPLDEVPAAGAVFSAELYSLGLAPRTLELTVNGKRGRFRLKPLPGQNVDERQANTIIYARQSLRVPMDAPHLRRGDNEIGLACRGDSGTIHYDSLELRRAAERAPSVAVRVEPTVFFRKKNAGLVEVTEVVLEHQKPLGKASVSLNVGGAQVTAESEDNGQDFGERIVTVEAPALDAPAPYALSVNTSAGPGRFQGEFRPEKRWKIFAGLKIHNDIGYTDLQSHVQELDNRNTDGVLDLTSKFPFYKFNFETSWLVENYLASRKPAQTQRLIKLLQGDQAAVSAMYLNVMTGLCTGEEMHRLLYYSKDLQRRYGIPLKFACLTDAPSHTWFVPSLLEDAGVAGFAVGSNQTRAPLLQNSSLNEDSPFYWEGIDGRRVLAWFARSYLQFNRLAGDNPTVEKLERSIPQFLARYRRPGYPVDAVLLYGLYTDNADLGGGDAETVKAWNEAYEYPKIIAATDTDYYDYLAKNFAGKLPVYRGDAGAYWEDGAGSTALETTLNRDSQRMLPAAEMAAALASVFRPEESYPADEFSNAWKNVLFYDEHTWGAHSSVRQPGRAFVTEQWDYKRAYAWRGHWAAKDLLLRSLNRLVQNISVDGPTMFVFNPDRFARTDAVTLELEPNRELVDMTSGKPVEVDVLSEQDGYRRLLFLAENVPGLGYRAYAVRRRENAAPSNGASAPGSWEIESRYYRLRLDRGTGAIAELVDKETGRDLVDKEAPYRLNELTYVSGGEHSRILQDLASLPPARLEISGQGSAQLVENTRTPFGSRIRVRSRAKNVPAIDTEITLHDRFKRVDIVNRIRKEETRAKEAVYFAYPFRASRPELSYQVQNSFVRANQDQLPGACRDWFTTQNLVRLRDGDETVAWSTPDAPLVTLTDINRGLWLKQLEVRNGHVFSYAMNNYWFTNYKAAQGGEFTFRYFLTSGRNLGEEELARFDASTRSPLVGYPYYDLGNVRHYTGKKRMPAAEGAFLAIDAGNAQVTAFKQAEDGKGYVVRVRETAGSQGVARLSSPVFAIGGASLANGVEDTRQVLAVNGGQVEIPLRPWQFTTVRLELGVR